MGPARAPAVVFLLATLVPCLAGVTEKPKASDYPAHAELPEVALGAEFMVRSYSANNQTFIVRDHLTVEVAIYPAKPLAISCGNFKLRINGKKQVLFAQTPQFVAASLKHPDWEQRPTLTAGAGVGNGGITIGGHPPVERFPGDPGARRPPQAPKAPDGVDRGGYGKPPEDMTPEELLLYVALAEGETKSPAAGYLFFAFKGKPSSIKSVELIYEGPAGGATLRLR